MHSRISVFPDDDDPIVLIRDDDTGLDHLELRSAGGVVNVVAVPEWFDRLYEKLGEGK